MNKKLGRGLEALISSVGIENNVSKENSSEVNINLIVPNPYQPRKHFDKDLLEELSASIKENGIIQPLIVRKKGANDYELIAGERRLQAAKLAQLSSVPIVIKEVKDEQLLQLAIIENIQRENLNPIEEAVAYKDLMEKFNLTHLEVAKIVGKQRATVTNSLRLLKLENYIQDLIIEKKISSGHAKVLLQLDENQRKEMIKNILENQLSVRDLEEKIKNILNKKPEQIAKKNNFSQEIENNLKNILNLKVKISGNEEKGKISLFYINQTEKEKIINLLKK